MKGTAIVTGAAAGIGAAIAARLFRDGFDVLAVDRQSATDRAAGACEMTLDIAAPDAPDRILERLPDGGATVLVNNAGIGGSQAVADTDDDSWRRIFDINLDAAFRLSRTVLPGMIARGHGVIVNMGSAYGQTGFRGTAAYAASKAALAGLTRQMAADYGRDGVRVNAVAPGLISTAMTARLLEDPVYRRLMLDGTPLPAPGLPEDVAGAVAFLVSDDARFITGTILPVDGGWSTSRISVAPDPDHES